MPIEYMFCFICSEQCLKTFRRAKSVASLVLYSRKLFLIILLTATSFFLPHQNLAKSHHLSSGAKGSKPLKYINTDIREKNIYDYD